MTRIQTITLAIFSVLLSLGLAAMASALTLENPQPIEYNGTIPLILSENQSAALAYTLSPGNLSDSCENCTNLSASLDLEPGTYTLNATSTIGNVTQSAAVSFSVINATANQTNETNQTLGPLTLTITNPQNSTYNTTSVPYTASANETVDSLAYRLDGANYTTVCQNCSSMSGTLTNVSEGSHAFSVRAIRANQTFVASGAFSVLLPAPNGTVNETNETNQTPLSLTIAHPTNKTYTTSAVPFRFETNRNAAITYTLNGANTSACSTCSTYVENKSLGNGSYSLFVLATSGNETVNKTVSFSVAIPVQDDDDKTEDNETDEPRYTSGLNKLPQRLVAGEVTDADLSQIIRDNKINPGVLNRLIKTGLLGNASITAILETQKTPPSLIRKIGRFIGFGFKTPREQLLEHYNLSVEQHAKLLVDNHISDETAREVKERIKEQQEAARELRKLEAELGREQAQAEAETAKRSAELAREAAKAERDTGKELAKAEREAAKREAEAARDAAKQAREHAKSLNVGKQKRN